MKENNMDYDKLQEMFEECGICVTRTIRDGIEEAELETFTEGGVNMIIYLSPFTLTEFNRWCHDFDIDEEVDLYRQMQDYRRAFTISESVVDFTDFIHRMRDICIKILSRSNQTESDSYKIWMRCGMEFDGTHEEIQALLNGDSDLLKMKVNSGQFTLIGESCIPEECIDELVRAHPDKFSDEFNAPNEHTVEFFIK